MELRGKHISVVGLARSGVAAAELCARAGARVTVTDSRGAEALAPERTRLASYEITWALGGHDAAALAKSDFIVLSPGVPLAMSALQPARAAGVPILAEVELASRLVAERLPGAILVGVTGTNGKSTTTALCAHLLAESGKKVFAGGNLGTPLSELLLSGDEPDAIVVELSSFQLETCRALRPRAATVLNITPDHLDRYPSMDVYAAAKVRIFQAQDGRDTAVLNAGDPRVMAMAPRLHARVLRFGGLSSAEGPDARDEHGTIVAFGEHFPVTARTLRGAHNRENAMAALLLAREAGATPDGVRRGLATYPGLPHRLEPVATLDGVEYVNDSKATNVDSVLKSLAAFPRGVHLLMGGRGKGAPYLPLRELFAGRVAGLYLIGEDAEAIRAALGDAAPTELSGDLATALRAARANAKPGDVVLLSPACASYDQFENFEHRGATFRALVAELGGAK